MPAPTRTPKRVGSTLSVLRAASSTAIDGINGPLLILLDVADGVAHRGDLLRVLVGDLEVELLLESHDQLDRVERVGAQVLDELRVGIDVVLLDSELLDDDLFHPLLDRLCHEHPPLPRELNSLHRCRRPHRAAPYMYRPPLTCIVCPVM